VRDLPELGRLTSQLALIARALTQQSPMVFMDEPTASLDLGNRMMVLDQIRALAESGLTVLLSTHDPEQALALADQVATLSADGSFTAGALAAILTEEKLTRIYGIPLSIERTESGRPVIGRPVPPTTPRSLKTDTDNKAHWYADRFRNITSVKIAKAACAGRTVCRVSSRNGTGRSNRALFAMARHCDIQRSP
jgi:ABC-type multidrug transport system ATPase subunit